MQSSVRRCRAKTPPNVGEDCRYLNIGAPSHACPLASPVIVGIHGGGYINGSASMPLYRGDRLAHKGVIVVTLACRLGRAARISRSA